MSDLPDANLLNNAVRARQRKQAEELGPDAGRRIDRLKRRSLSADKAAALLEAAERGALAPKPAGLLTGHDAAGETQTYFDLDWSALDGGDVLG